MNAGLGFVLALAAGIMNGSFTIPLKKTTKWAWENAWLVWAFVALLVVPWVIAAHNVPDLMGVYSQAGFGALALAFCFGLGWGIGALSFGRSVALLGVSLSFAISFGLVTALGSFVPMLAKPSTFSTPSGKTITAGIVIMIIGVIVCAVAGGRKEAQTTKAESGEARSPRGSFAKGLAICVFSGVVQPMLNFAFAFGDSIKEAAVASGASAGGGVDAIWSIALLGGFIPNLIFCSTLLTRNRTWSAYRKTGTTSYWFLAALMGLLWICSVAIYGRAATLMGTLGGSAGWAVFLGCCIVVSSIWGIITGEWREGAGKPIKTMYVGLAVLLFAIAIIGYGNSLPN